MAKGNYKEALKNKEYRKLLCSSLINRFGDSIDAIAFTWLVYQITHSASWSAIIYGLNVLPNIFLQPFLGPIAERMDKKKVIILTDVARAVVISAFVMMYLFGIVNPYLMATFTLIITSIESFNLPASGAFIPLVVKEEDLTHSMSLSSSLSSVVSLIGTGAAGIIIAVFGIQAAMLIDAATFIIATILIFFIKPLKKETFETNEKAMAEQSYFALLKDGLSYVRKNHIILNICLVAVFMNFFFVPLNALEAPIVEECFGMGSQLLSVMGMAASVGAILGSLLMPMVMERLSIKQILIICGTAIGAFMYILSLGKYLNGSIVGGYLLAGGCYFMMMLAVSILNGSVSVQFMKICDQNYLARAGSVLNASTTAAMPIASIIVSFATMRLSAGFLIASCGIMVIALLVLVSFSRLDFELVKKELTDAA